MAHGSGLENVETLVRDIIATWQLLAPTIIFQDELIELCLERQWVLCLSESVDANEYMSHMDRVNEQRKQDGIIFIGREGHEKLLNILEPSIFTSNIPVFLPAEYASYLNLRLDSNLIFYKRKGLGKYELIDQFAVKKGPPIIEVIGFWEIGMGVTFLKSINRWDRRKDLKGALLVDCVAPFSRAAGLIKDRNGTILGSKGYFPEVLSLIIEDLNAHVKTNECAWGTKLLKNGSWTGHLGLLQNKVIDVSSTSSSINFQRSGAVDLPLPTRRSSLTLIAAIPTGSSPEVWVYVNIFGIHQWITFFALLVLTAAALYFLNILIGHESSMEFGNRRGAQRDIKLSSSYSAIALVYLYTIQMGSHTDSKQLPLRLLTLTLSFLTMLLFIYYASDITAEMTSGSSGRIPIRTFEDVIHHDYKVITNTQSFEEALAFANPNSAKNIVYRSRFERRQRDNQSFIDSTIEIMKEIIHDNEKLYYASIGYTIPNTPSQKVLTDQVFALKMDDALYHLSTLPLQKESEFLPLFNHRILKLMECGLMRKLYLKHNANLYVKENFEMTQPQPLRYNNVIFPTLCLGVGIALSVVKAIEEFFIMKVKQKMQ